MENMDKFDELAAKRARDRGIGRTSVKNAEWMNKAHAHLRKMKFDGYEEVTGEEIRHWLLTRGMHPPSSAHTWGAMIHHAVKDKILEDTMRVRHMVTEKSHARRTPIWKLL